MKGILTENGVKLCNSDADKIYTKGYGKRRGKCVILAWEEALYLSETGTLKEPDFETILKNAAKIPYFDIRHLVYRDLRKRGYVIRVAKVFYARKSYSMQYLPIGEGTPISFDELYSMDKPFVLAVVDGDGDITYYMVREASPQGTFHRLPDTKLTCKFYGNRVYLFDNLESLKGTTYGTVESVFAHLSVMEAEYLREKGLIDIPILVRNDIYSVYRDLRERGLIVKSGFKYGTHFRVYENSMEEHSKYLVHVVGREETLQSISRAIRVANGVRKKLLLANVHNEKIRYLELSWIRP